MKQEEFYEHHEKNNVILHFGKESGKEKNIFIKNKNYNNNFFASIIEKKPEEVILNKNSEFSLLYDLSCLKKRKSQIIDVNINEQNNNSKKFFSYAIEEEVTLKEIMNLQKKEPCLLKIYESSKVKLKPDNNKKNNQNHHLSANILISKEAEKKNKNNILQKHLDFIQIKKIDSLIEKINKNVVVAVIDSGVNIENKNLKKRIWQNNNKNFLYDIADNDADPTPGKKDHGTEVAGIISSNGNIRGISGVSDTDFVKIMPIKVFSDTNEKAKCSTIANGIMNAADEQADIIVVSLGLCIEYFTAVPYAIKKGSLVILSASNYNEEIPEYWSNIGKKKEGAVVVGAIDMESGLKCPFSSYNPNVIDIAAPGCGGLIFTPSQKNNYKNFHGTSASAPQVAGIAAIIIGIKKSNNENISPQQTEAILYEISAFDKNLNTFFDQGKILRLENTKMLENL